MKNSLTKIYAKYILMIIALFSGANLFAQTTSAPEQDSLSVFSNPLFNVLLTIIVFLIIIIAVLGSVLKNVAAATSKEKSNSSGKILSIVAILVFLSISHPTFAQSTNPVNLYTGYLGLSSELFLSMISLIVLQLIIIAVLLGSIQLLVKKNEDAIIKAEKTVPTLYEKLTASVSIEDEESILMDHDYDGIKELDNDLPPWWKYGFYITIVFAFLYLVHYHVTRTGDLQIAEYNKSMDLAHEAKEAYQKANAENVNENTAKMIIDKHELEEAATTFQDNCAVCHGKQAGGNIGPNLTDNYWLHGGTIKDIFTTIKYGYEDKGMKSWQAELTPLKINELASYIKTLSGSNPANPKAPQGDLFVEKGTNPRDSTKKDSTAVMPLIDSVKVNEK